MKIQSFTNPDSCYQIDADKKTCSCLAFKKNPQRPCKHLLSIPDLFPPSENINLYEAMSAFIKSIRLRLTDEAILWLCYLWNQPGLKSRIQRRILMSAGEDNISVNVIEAVSNWYGNNSTRKDLTLATIEVARICATDNWYAQPDGRFYMFAWEKATIEPKQGLPKDYPALLEFFTNAIIDCREIEALKAFNRLYENESFRPRDFANTLQSISKVSNSHQAHRLVELYVKNAGALWLDGNLSGQAVFALLNGDFGDATLPVSNEKEVLSLLQDAQYRITNGVEIPAFARDGIHTRKGGDVRFAGTIKQMAACCRAYEYFGRLSPDDKWLAQFYEPELV